MTLSGQPADSQRPASPADPARKNKAAGGTVKTWMAARVAADEQMRTAAAEHTSEPAEPEDADQDHDLIMLLTKDHNRVRSLVQQLSALPGHKKGGSAADLARRESIVGTITARLSRHELAEEELLWPTARSLLADGDSWAEGALKQEQEGKVTLAALGHLEPDSDEFDEHAEQLVAQLRKHVAYEEKVFLLLRDAVAREDLQKLGARLVAADGGTPRGDDPPRPPGTAKD